MKHTHTQKYLSLQLDSKLSFNEYTNNEINKATKGKGLLRNMQPIVLHRSLLTIYKSFIRPHLDWHHFHIKLNKCCITQH